MVMQAAALRHNRPETGLQVFRYPLEVLMCGLFVKTHLLANHATEIQFHFHIQGVLPLLQGV